MRGRNLDFFYEVRSMLVMYGSVFMQTWLAYLLLRSPYFKFTQESLRIIGDGAVVGTVLQGRVVSVYHDPGGFNVLSHYRHDPRIVAHFTAPRSDWMTTKATQNYDTVARKLAD